MGLTITYKGATIVDEQGSYEGTLKTAGKYCEGDIHVACTGGGGGGSKPIYGIMWNDGDASNFVRTHDAASFAEPVCWKPDEMHAESPFDEILPWGGMVKHTDPTYGELVKIPEFYWKINRDEANGTTELLISEDSHGGLMNPSPAHNGRRWGSMHENASAVYCGRYRTNGEQLVSQAGTLPTFASISSRYSFGDDNQVPADGVFVYDYLMHMSLWMLMTVEYGPLFGEPEYIGVGIQSRTYTQSGSTDEMPYHTGRTASGNVQYRNIEDLWGNGPALVCGIRASQYTQNITLVTGYKYDGAEGRHDVTINSEMAYGLGSGLNYWKTIVERQSTTADGAVINVPLFWNAAGSTEQTVDKTVFNTYPNQQGTHVMGITTVCNWTSVNAFDRFTTFNGDYPQLCAPRIMKIEGI